MSASFDRIARFYWLFEKVCFGGALQNTRQFCIPWVSNRKRALILGDGDGRFSLELLKQNAGIQIDSIDLSNRMLDLAEQRTGEYQTRIKHIHADVLNYQFPEKQYDLICLHFFIDCFTQSEVNALKARIFDSLDTGGIVVYSDFDTKKRWHNIVVRSLYLAFRIGTSIKAQRLPSFEKPESFSEIASHSECSNLLFSKIWKSTG